MDISDTYTVSMAWQVLYVNSWSFCPLLGRYLRNNDNDTMNYDTAISAVPSQILAYVGHSFLV